MERKSGNQDNDLLDPPNVDPGLFIAVSEKLAGHPYSAKRQSSDPYSVVVDYGEYWNEFWINWNSEDSTYSLLPPNNLRTHFERTAGLTLGEALEALDTYVFLTKDRAREVDIRDDISRAAMKKWEVEGKRTSTFMFWFFLAFLASVVVLMYHSF